MTKVTHYWTFLCALSTGLYVQRPKTIGAVVTVKDDISSTINLNTKLVI